MEVREVNRSPDDVMSLPTTYPDDFEVVDLQEAAMPQTELNKITKWLAPTDYDADSSEFRRHLSSLAPGTGSWLCDTDSYLQWHDSSLHGSLWIKGVPGAGKSVIAASIIDHLMRNEPNTPVLFFFFRNVVHANQRSRSLVCDWLAQLLHHSITLQATLSPLIETPQGNVSDQILWECLIKALSSIDRAYCLVDAMDEMEATEADPFFRRLNELATFRPNAVKVLMTSRPQQYLQSNLRASSIVHISLEEERVTRDIRSFLSYRLSTSLPSTADAERRECLVNATAARSAGLFLYARLLVDQLLPALEQGRDVDFDKLPVGLEDMYNGVLLRQSAELNVGVGVQIFLLSCVTQCFRPLRLLELASLLSIYLKSDMTPAEAKVLVKQACGPLLEVLDDETVQILHHSFAEFLLDPDRRTDEARGIPQFPLINPTAVHKQLATLCMDLLKSLFTQRNAWHQTPSHPLLNYAQTFWIEHASLFPQIGDKELFNAMTEFSETPAFQQWGMKITSQHGVRRNVDCLTALHLASYIGILEYAKCAIESGNSLTPAPGSPNFQSIRGPKPPIPHSHSWSCLPVWWACRQGHVQMVKYLLPRTELPVLGRSGYTCGPDLIEVAVSRGHNAVLELLLEAGLGPLGFGGNDVDENDTDYHGEERLPDAMDLVTQQYDPPCLATTLPYLDQGFVGRLLCVYAGKGNAEAVELILESKRVNPNATYRGRPALYWACWAHDLNRASSVESRGYNIGLNHGSLECVRLLLQAGSSIQPLTSVDRPKRSMFGDVMELYEEKKRTPLHGLISAWNNDTHEVAVPIFKLLIEAGASLEEKDGLGDTPLLSLFPLRHAQFRVGRPLEYLLKNGADATALDANGRSTLHRVLLYHRDPRLIQLLASHGTDVNGLCSVDGRGNKTDSTPPLGLLFQDPMYYLLVDLGTTPQKSLRKEKAVQCTTENREIARILINFGAYIDAGGSDKALLKALPVCDLETLKLLLDSRRDSNIVENVLFALQQTYVPSPEGRPLDEMVAVLVAAGASLEEKNMRGLTPLLASVDSPTMFEALLRAGANRNATDPRGNGVLHVFMSRTHLFQQTAPSVERLQQLVQHGFDPLCLNRVGDTLLHLAVYLEDPSPYEIKKTGPTLLLLLRQLLNYGISPRGKNYAGMSPLHSFFENMTGSIPSVRGMSASRTEAAAAPENVERLIKFLQEVPGGIDINARDNDGLTPLHIAAMSMSPHAVQCLHVLISLGADVNALTDSRRSALHLACTARNTPVMPFLLDHAGSALLNRKDARGRTPLFDACRSGVLESVGMLLDAGAEVNIEDWGGRTPLHACAEFASEQQRWDTVEYVEWNRWTWVQPYEDRYRPFKPTPSTRAPGEQRVSQRGKREFRMTGSETDDYYFKSTFLKNPTMAIYAVVKRMIEAGARNVVTEKCKISPAEYAWNYPCHGMMLALAELGLAPAGHHRVAEVILGRREGVSSAMLPEAVRDEILRNPVSYLSQFNLEDIVWLVRNRADLTTPFCVVEGNRMHFGYSLSGGDNYLSSRLSFTESVALLGLTVFMENIGEAARYYDGPSNTIDEWSVRTLANLQNAGNRADDTWTLQKLAETHHLKIRPLVVKACERPCPNLEILKVLVNTCGVDVNAREIRYSYSTLSRRDQGALTALGYMALQQEYWHLRAIRFLVNSGADINTRDINGETPLFIACIPNMGRRWAPLFVKLLLELGADPNIPDANGTNCVDIAVSEEILDLLAEGGANIASRQDYLLYAAIENLDLDMMRRALKAGADLNESKEIYKWKFQGFIRSPGQHDGYPIVGAFIHNNTFGSSRTEGRETPETVQRRCNMIRFMLDHGADPFVRLRDGKPFFHALLEKVYLEDVYLDLLLEYSPKINLETRDSGGRTVFLVSCGLVDMRSLNYNNGKVYDAWRMPGKLIDRGADITALDNSGMNALVSHAPQVLSFLSSS